MIPGRKSDDALDENRAVTAPLLQWSALLQKMMIHRDRFVDLPKQRLTYPTCSVSYALPRSQYLYLLVEEQRSHSSLWQCVPCECSVAARITCSVCSRMSLTRTTYSYYSMYDSFPQAGAAVSRSVFPTLFRFFRRCELRNQSSAL